MQEERKRILFLSAQRSVRELMAASLLAAQAWERWNIWIAPGTFDTQAVDLVRQVLEEVHVPLLSSPKQPSHPLIAHGTKALFYVVAQPINDPLSPTPVGVISGLLKMCQQWSCRKQNDCWSIVASVRHSFKRSVRICFSSKNGL